MITDELREYALGWDERNRVHSDLTAIADRIDAEYQKALSGAYADKMDASGWVKLPVDADGEVIRAGDELDGYGKTIEVVELRHGRSGWVLISRDGNAYADTYAFAHHHATTVEDVLRELLGEYDIKRGYPCGHIKPKEEVIAEYAKLLMLADEGKGQ